MKPLQLPTDYSLVCVGSYTRAHFEDLLINPEFRFVHSLISMLASEMPETADVVRADLQVNERMFSTRKRPANIFELLWFAKKFPEFPALYGPIECSQDPYLDAFIRDVGIKLGVVILKFDPRREGLVIDLDEYGVSGRDSKFELVVPC